MARPAHVPALDGVRGLAILLVLFHNFNVGQVVGPAPVRLVRYAIDAGWIGVQLFFVLSGFLITGILVDTKRAQNYYRAFYARRTLRIFPLYFGVLTAWFVVLPLFVGRSSPLLAGAQNQVWLWTYLSNWAEPYGRTVAAFPHFWSLAVEEQFYLVWPLVVMSLAPRRLFALCGVLAVVSLLARVVMRTVVHAELDAVYQFTFCRMDALVLGGMAAVGLRDDAIVAWFTARARLVTISVAVLFVVGLALRDFSRLLLSSQTAGYSILALLFTWLVVRAERFAIFASAPLRWLGRYSYGIYVVHMPLNIFVGQPLVHRLHPGDALPLWLSLAYIAAGTVASALVAFASYHLVEKHFLRLKSRFEAA